MTSIVPLMIQLLKAAAPVGAIVGDRIEPELAPQASALPCIVVRSATARQTYGLARAAPISEARFTVLCAAGSYTAADRLAETVKAALRDVRHVRIAGQSVTLFQDGDDTGTWDEQGREFARIVGYRASVSN